MVMRPTTPSGKSPGTERWKARTAFSVSVPYLPSGLYSVLAVDMGSA